jgi:hypothetical protein
MNVFHIPLVVNETSNYRIVYSMTDSACHIPLASMFSLVRNLNRLQQSDDLIFADESLRSATLLLLLFR